MFKSAIQNWLKNAIKIIISIAEATSKLKWNEMKRNGDEERMKKMQIIF